MKKKMVWKLSLAALLFAIMTAVPAAASAATAATIGNKKYSSLDKALAAAKNGQTIKLKKNAEYHTNYFDFVMMRDLSSPKLDKKITLDLNKKKLTVKDHSYATVYTGGQLSINNKMTIKNGTIIGDISAGKKGNLTLSDVKLKPGNLVKWNTISCWQGGKAKVTGCSCPDIKISVSGSKSSMTLAKCSFTGCQSELFLVGAADSNKASLEIRSGNYTAKGTDYLFNIQKSGTVTVKGGTFSAAGEYALNTVWGKMNIKGGSFTGGRAAYTHVLDGGILNLSGGKLVLNVDHVRACVDMSGGSVVNMTGGSITSKGLYSGGIAIDGDGRFGEKAVVTGGTITSKHNFAILGPRACISVGSNARLVVPAGEEKIRYTDQN